MYDFSVYLVCTIIVCLAYDLTVYNFLTSLLSFNDFTIYSVTVYQAYGDHCLFQVYDIIASLVYNLNHISCSWYLCLVYELTVLSGPWRHQCLWYHCLARLWRSPGYRPKVDENQLSSIILLTVLSLRKTKTCRKFILFEQILQTAANKLFSILELILAVVMVFLHVFPKQRSFENDWIGKIFSFNKAKEK